MNNSQNKYWKTVDLYLAAFLYGRGAIIVGIEAVERKATFSFIDSLDRQNWHEEFRSGTPMIDARIYICAIQTLRQKRLDALMET
jgi:hypothetical protein